MFNLGLSEIIFLAAIALIVIGPKQLPELARTIARLLNEFKRATRDVTSPMKDIQRDAADALSDARESFKESIDLDPSEKNPLPTTTETSKDSSASTGKATKHSNESDSNE